MEPGKNMQGQTASNEDVETATAVGNTNDKSVETDADKISEWIIEPDRVKIIGCGEYGNKLVDEMYINYASKLAGLKHKNFNKPTKPDYLDLKLLPDYRNIRAAGIKREVEEELERRNGEKHISGSREVKKVSLLKKIKNVFGQKEQSHDDSGVDDIPAAEALPSEVHDEAAVELEADDGPVVTNGKVDDDNPEVGGASMTAQTIEDQRDMIVQKAKVELENELKEFLKDTDLLFIVTDMKSPFGLDNSLTAAKLARSENTISVGVVVLPTTLDKLDEVENGNRSLQAFRLMADIIVVVPALKHVIDGYIVLIISELIELMTTSGLINLDVADVKTVVGGGNVAMIGFGAGFSRDEDKIIGAINEAVSSPILNVDLNGVNRTLVNVTGDSNMTISEAQKVARVILDRIQPDARLIWGASISPKLNGAIKVMVMVGVKPKNILVHIYANS